MDGEIILGGILLSLIFYFVGYHIGISTGLERAHQASKKNIILTDEYNRRKRNVKG